ncbi:MAG: twin-arginine translocase subunit TatC [Anaerolineae bacterium]
MSEEKLTLLEHIQELRHRLFRAIIALIVGALFGALITNPAIRVLVRPLQQAEVIVLSPTEAPIIYFKVALFLGFLIALPYITYQIYAFVRPGLYPKEQKVFLLAVPSVFILFLLGATFTLTILIPFSIPVLMGFLRDVVTPTYSLEQYLSFVTTLLFWMGLLFQTPLVIYILARVGIVEPKTLKRVRKVVIFLAALLAAVITPTTDPVTMLLVMGPFVVLYEVGIVLARVAIRQKRV